MKTKYIDYSYVVENYGLPVRLMDRAKYSKYHRQTVHQIIGCTDNDKAIFCVVSTMSVSIMSMSNDEVKVMEYRDAIDTKLKDYCKNLNEEIVDTDSIYARNIYYFDSRQLGFIRKYNRSLANSLAKISHIDADTILTLSYRVKCHDITRLIIEFTIMAQNLMYT